MSSSQDNQPKCKYCYDKKYFSVAEGGNIVRGDFIGDQNYIMPIEIMQYPCRKCNLPLKKKAKKQFSECKCKHTKDLYKCDITCKICEHCQTLESPKPPKLEDEKYGCDCEANAIENNKTGKIYCERCHAPQNPKYYSIPKTESKPMGVSQWAEYGKKYGYWDYFLNCQTSEGTISKLPEKPESLELTEEDRELLRNWEIKNVVTVDGLDFGKWVKKSTVKKLLAAKDREAEEKVRNERERIESKLNDNIEPIIMEEKNYFVMLRDLDDQYQQAFSEMAYSAQETILDLLDPEP